MPSNTTRVTQVDGQQWSNELSSSADEHPDLSDDDIDNDVGTPSLAVAEHQLQPNSRQHLAPTKRKRKRDKSDDKRNPYRRKRAVRACQLCRNRKSKCDNQTPSCGSCAAVGAVCIYQNATTDLSALDPASLAILDRVNHAIRLIEIHSNQWNPQDVLSMVVDQRRNSSDRPSDYQSTSTTLHQDASSSSATHGSARNLTAEPTDTGLRSPDSRSSTARCVNTSIMDWPIFASMATKCDLTKLFYESETLDDTGSATSNTASPLGHITAFDRGLLPGRGVHEEDVPHLIAGFLKNVHTKNPVLDPNSVTVIGRRISNDGFEWDDNSCMVSIVCALGALSRPFVAKRPGKMDISYVDAEDYGTAEQYYSFARKRLGLLSTSITAVQCLFLFGVYEMYSLRPLRAWLSFSQACTLLSAYFHTHAYRSTQDQSRRRLEQRLYWSCLKSEWEVRDEVDLPASSLAFTDYSNGLPSPPGGTPPPEGSVAGSSDSPSLDQDSQLSWYYYLSEIAIRRVANRITRCMYHCESDKWLTLPLRQMLRVANELDLQISQWSEHMPSAIGFGNDADPSELTYILQLRYIQLRERVARPFLYILIHSKTPVPIDPTVEMYALRCVQDSIKFISHATIKHRHHGTWQIIREVFTQSLNILALVLSGRKQNLPSGWDSAIELAMDGLNYWKVEAPDLRIAQETLRTIFSNAKEVLQ